MKPYKIGSTFADNVLEFQLGAFNEVVLQKYNQKSDNLTNKTPYKAVKATIDTMSEKLYNSFTDTVSV